MKAIERQRGIVPSMKLNSGMKRENFFKLANVGHRKEMFPLRR
jgi:hypothetical protein